MTSWQRTLTIMIFAQLMSSVGFSIMFPFLPRYVDVLGSSFGLDTELLAAAVFSSQALTMMLASPIWGAVSDQLGRKLMVERAAYGGAITLFLMAFAPSAEVLVLFRAVQGLVTGTVSAGNALVAASVPRHKVGYAMGLLQLGLGSGVAIGPLLGGLMADTVGYRATFVVTAVLLALSGLLVSVGVQERFTRPDTSAQRRSLLGGWGQVLRVPGVGITYTLSFFNWLGRNMLIPIIPLFITTLPLALDRTNTVIGLIVGIAAATGTASAICIGRMGDRLGHRTIVTACALAAALFYLPQSFVTTVWQLLLLQALTGIAVGGMTPSIAALLAHYTKPGEEGTVYGLDNAIVSASRTVAPMLGAGIVVWVRLYSPQLGVSLAAGLEYRSIFVVTGALYLLTALIAAWKLPGLSRTVDLKEPATALGD